jgi:hypothetical protein
LVDPPLRNVSTQRAPIFWPCRCVGGVAAQAGDAGFGIRGDAVTGSEEFAVWRERLAV